MNTKVKTEKNVVSHSGLHQKWYELPEYAGYVPAELPGWEEVKKQFNLTNSHGETYGPTNSFLIRLVKDGNEIVLRLCGFKRQTLPGIAYCKDPQTDKCIAIAWRIGSHFAFGEHWNELPEYAGYVPTQYTNWHSLKEQFHASGKYGYERPLPVNIRKDNNTIVVNLYGFKIPDSSTVASFGTPAAIIGRVALCKTIISKEYIAIAW